MDEDLERTIDPTSGAISCRLYFPAYGDYSPKVGRRTFPCEELSTAIENLRAFNMPSLTTVLDSLKGILANLQQLRASDMLLRSLNQKLCQLATLLGEEPFEGRISNYRDGEAQRLVDSISAVRTASCK